MNPIKLLREKWNPPAERKESFKGQAVLVTGANTGLGLEAAKKIAALEADKLIITTRNKGKGETTKKAIAEWLAQTGSSTRTEIVHVDLEMTASKDIRDFVQRLRSVTDKLDSVILNAGVTMPKHQTTPDGFEQTLAINAINTVYLAHLLLPTLLETSKSTGNQPHLTIVSSRNATMPAVVPDERVVASSQPLVEISKPEAFPPGAMGGFIMYGRSKLILEYAIRNMSQLSELYDTDKQPRVIINSVCPGATQSDLGRNWDNFWVQLFARIFTALFTKTAEQGANAYLTALSQGNQSMGQMWANDSIVPEWAALQSAEGKKLSANVWDELQQMMHEWDRGN